MPEFYLRPIIRIEASSHGEAVDQFLKLMEDNNIAVRGWA